MLTGQAGDPTIDYAIQGTHNTPTVVMQLTRPGSPVASLNGGFTTDTTITGQLSGIGPSGRALTLIRATCYCPPSSWTGTS